MKWSTLRNSAPDIPGVGVTIACIVHCIGLPVAAAIMPGIAHIFELEIAHQALVLLAFLCSGPLLFYIVKPRRRIVSFLALFGLALLYSAAFVTVAHDYETSLTILGGLSLIAAHALRWKASLAPRPVEIGSQQTSLGRP